MITRIDMGDEGGAELHHAHEILIADGLPIDADTFIDPLKMGTRETPDGQVEGLKEFGHHQGGGGFAIRPHHMDDRGVGFRIIHRVTDSFNPFQARFNNGFYPFKNEIDRIVVGGRNRQVIEVLQQRPFQRLE